ncbi:MAG: LLM class flavin-dependent oxidoreductase [Defluviitaleaceae bacterium]|nr:LLM class flavin-dependent oxidoreductase [Defluviitaleaceae bacterium]
MEYGIWLPIFGGWLRNVENEQMPPTFEYAKQVAQRAEDLGFSKILVAELYLNDIKGIEENVLEAWTTSAALAAVTNEIELMSAVRPAYHNPAVVAKMAANISEISGGRFTLNVVSAWWEEEARQYGGLFTTHDERYARTEEFVNVLKGLWTEPTFNYKGKFYHLQNAKFAPKPQKLPTLYAGGESEQGKSTIASHCDAYVMHGGTVDEVKVKIDEMKERRIALGKEPFESFGMAAYVICRDTEEEAQAELARITKVASLEGYAGYQDFTTKSELEQKVALQDYSVSNRGLRPHLIGTPEQIANQILAYQHVGVDFLLLQSSPQLEEMERFAKQVMPLVQQKSR